MLNFYMTQAEQPPAIPRTRAAASTWTARSGCGSTSTTTHRPPISGSSGTCAAAAFPCRCRPACRSTAPCRPRPCCATCTTRDASSGAKGCAFRVVAMENQTLPGGVASLWAELRRQVQLEGHLRLRHPDQRLHPSARDLPLRRARWRVRLPQVEQHDERQPVDRRLRRGVRSGRQRHVHGQQRRLPEPLALGRVGRFRLRLGCAADDHGRVHQHGHQRLQRHAPRHRLQRDGLLHRLPGEPGGQIPTFSGSFGNEWGLT